MTVAQKTFYLAYTVQRRPLKSLTLIYINNTTNYKQQNSTKPVKQSADEQALIAS